MNIIRLILNILSTSALIVGVIVSLELGHIQLAAILIGLGAVPYTEVLLMQKDWVRERENKNRK
jgi:hypothetical protein